MALSQASLSIDSDVSGLKSFLFDYFTKAKLGAIITHTQLNETHVLFEGPLSRVEKSLRVLPELVSVYFEGFDVAASELHVSSQRLDGVKIVETAPTLKRSPSSGDLKEIPLEDELSLG